MTDDVRRGSMTCKACDWIAIMRGDTDAEIADFLRMRFAAHVDERHSEGPDR